MAYEILKDSTGKNGIPQFFNTTGVAFPLVGDKAPFSQVVDAAGVTLFTSANPANVKLAVDTTAITFQDAITATGTGTTFVVNGNKTITLEISGTSTSRTIQFQASGPSGTFYPISGVNLSDMSVSSATTGTGALWQFDVTGVESFRANVTGIAGGNVTIKGKAVI